MRPSLVRSWSLRDRLSAAALLAYEASVGPCGHSHATTVGDLEGWFEVDDTMTCWACAALDDYRHAHEESGSPSGAILRVVDTRLEDSEEA